MIDVIYKYSNTDNEELTLKDFIIKDGNNYNSVYRIYFNMDNVSIEIETERFDAVHFQNYLFIKEKGNVTPYWVTTDNIKNLIGGKTIDKNGKEKINKCLLLERFLGSNELGDLENVISSIKDKFYDYKENKYYELKDEFKEYFKDVDKKSLYTLGYIIKNNKKLFCEDEKYVKWLKQFKLGEKKIKEKESVKENNCEEEFICDFCRQRLKKQFMINNFGKTDPFKLENLKSFTSTYAKGFYNIDNSETQLKKNIRCCMACMKKLQKYDRKLNEFQIATLKEKKPNRIKKEEKEKKEKKLTVFVLIENIFNIFNPSTIEQVKEILAIIFNSNLQEKLERIKELKNDILVPSVNTQFLSINIYFALYEQKKNQVILEIKDLSVKDICELIDIMIFLEKRKKFLVNNIKISWNLDYIFKLISIFNYKVSLDFIKSFFYKKPFASNLILKGFLKHITSSIFKKDQNDFYENLTLDLSLLIELQRLLKEKILEDKMNEILKDEDFLEEKVRKDQTKYFSVKPLESIVRKFYTNIMDWEINLMILGEIVYKICNSLDAKEKSGRERKFFEKINFSGMNKDDIIKFINFINFKMSQYSKDLEYEETRLREDLNKVVQGLQNIDNNTFDKNIAVLRIIDGYNFILRLNEIAKNKNYQLKEKNN